MTSPGSASSSARARSLIALAAAQGSGALCLDGGAHHSPDDVHQAPVRAARHRTVDGALHRHACLRWPDAFPKEDIAVRNTLGGITAREAEERSQVWRPWRSYAVMHLWASRSGSAEFRRI